MESISQAVRQPKTSPFRLTEIVESASTGLADIAVDSKLSHVTVPAHDGHKHRYETDTQKEESPTTIASTSLMRGITARSGPSPSRRGHVHTVQDNNSCRGSSH